MILAAALLHFGTVCLFRFAGLQCSLHTCRGLLVHRSEKKRRKRTTSVYPAGNMPLCTMRGLPCRLLSLGERMTSREESRQRHLTLQNQDVGADGCNFHHLDGLLVLWLECSLSTWIPHHSHGRPDRHKTKPCSIRHDARQAYLKLISPINDFRQAPACRPSSPKSDMSWHLPPDSQIQ